MTAKTKNEGALGTYTDIFCTACALCLYSAMPPIVEDRNGPLEADRLMAVGLNRAMDTKIKPVMLTPLQQKRVWENMLGAEIRENYFADLSGRYLPHGLVWIRATLAVVAAAISLYSVVMQNQKFAVDSSDLYAHWERLAHDYQRLRDNTYSEDAVEVLDKLVTCEEELSKGGSSA